MRHAQAEQAQGREQTARGRIGDELADEGLRVDGAVHQVGELLDIKEQQPFVL